MMNCNDKIIESYNVDDYEILTHNGWVDIKSIHKTKKFEVWKLKTKSHTLKCADEHLVVTENFNTVYVKDLKVGDKLLTDTGVESVVSLKKVKTSSEHMYDVTIDSKDHLYYVSGILSHNTTVVNAFLLHYIVFNSDKTVAIIANKEDTAFEIMDRIQKSYMDLPKFLQQGIREWNKGSITLSNNTKVVAKATSKGSISGLAISMLYIDEFAKIPIFVINDFVTSTMPVISSGKTAKIIISSTPVGQNSFYDFWVRAVRGKSDFYPIKVNWWEVYSQSFKDATIRNYGEAYWLQEYSLRFIGSTNTLIDPDILEKLIANDPKYFKYGELLKIWEKPIRGCKYVLGVDSGKGLGKNYSVVQVLKILEPVAIVVKNDKGEDVEELVENVEQVAIYRHNKISPHNYADVCVDIAKYYNNAYMMIENNNDCGGIVGERIWHELSYEFVCNFEKVEIGIKSTKKSKLIANLLLKKFVESGWLKINDKDTIDELGKYVEVSLNVFKGETRDTLDDCVTGLLWAIYFLRTHYNDGFKGTLDSDISQELGEESEDYNNYNNEDYNDGNYLPSFYIT